MKRIAIVHDNLLHIGGAEKVLFAFLEAFPDADIFMPIALKKYLPLLQTKGKINVSFLGKLPFVEKYASWLKPLVLIYWESLNLKNYDLIISSSHSFSSKSVNKGKRAKHISYIHTPPKYLYEEFNQMNWIKKFPFSLIFWPILTILRNYDYLSAQKADLIITNSKNVQQRIKKYYNRKSTVIYPPHSTAPKGFRKKTGKYFLFFSRIEKQKGAELIIKTCTRFNLPLVVVGTGSQEKQLKKNAGKTVKFVGFIDEKTKPKIFSHVKALLFAAIDEDYGLVIPEVISYQIPVIAYSSGATKETLNLSKDSKLDHLVFKKYTQSALYEAITKFNKINKLKKNK